MEGYTIIDEVGKGSFGNVWRALCKESGEVVAIKKMKKKYNSWEECLNLREVKSLKKMNHHNIVKLKKVIRENDVLYFVFEYMEFTLLKLIEGRVKVFSEVEVRKWCFQVFQGLAYIHQQGYFHRDLKPENLLVSNDIIKVADFGLAREIYSLPPFTEYVSTRWYRAPEVLLQSPVYGPPVDMWAMGAIMAELFTLRPLFPGSSEADEVYKICCVIGSPTYSEWAEGLKLASTINYHFPQVAGVGLSMLIPGVSADAINLISSLCSWDPSKRPSAMEALQHPFFQSCYYIPPSLRYKAAPSKTPPVETRGVLEQSGWKYPATELKSNSMNSAMATLCSSVQRKLNLNHEDISRNDNNQQKNGKYRAPGMNVPPGYSGRMGGGAYYEKLATNPIAMAIPQPMKCGGWQWHEQSDMFPRRSPYNKNVAG